MAYALNVSTSSPVPRSFGREASEPSRSSIGSGGTVQHNRLRSISTSSLSSVGSYFLPSFRSRQPDKSSTPPRSASSINFNKIRDRYSVSSRHSSLTSTIGSRFRSESFSARDSNDFRLGGVAESEAEPSRKSEDFDSISEGVSDASEHIDDSESTLQFPIQSPVPKPASPPRRTKSTDQPVFRRWTSKLRRKRRDIPQALSRREERWTLDDFDGAKLKPASPRRSAHKKSDSSNSSLRFVTAMKSATATIASASIAAISRHSDKWRQRQSSLISDREPRPSVDSTRSARSVIDEAAKQRSRKRREKLEELIRTEESYVADIKALSDVRGLLRNVIPSAN